MLHQLRRCPVIIAIGVAQAADASETAGAAAVGPKIIVRGQGRNPGTLFWKTGNVRGAEKGSEVAPTACGKCLAVAGAEIITNDCAARQIELSSSKLMVFVEVLAKQLQLVGESRIASPSEPAREVSQINTSPST